jgi:hypothetical protein
MGQRTYLVNQVGLERHPESLAESARQMIVKFGYTDKPAQQAHGFRHEGKEAIRFWYRQWPQTLLANSFYSGWNEFSFTRIDPANPPWFVPGELGVDLDPAGRLIRFRAIPGFKPDISVFGKVIGGGMPLAAFGGSKDVMSQLAPLGPVYQAGTLSGNPVATACGLATLREIAKPGFFDALAASTRSLVAALSSAARDNGVAFSADSEGGMFGFFFADTLPQHYGAVMATDKERFNRFFHAMLDAGVYLAPSAFEAGFVSAAHTADDIAATVALAQAAFAALR